MATEALGLGFVWGAIGFGAAIAASYFVWRVGGNAVLTFWIGYILTRPFGAALGDMLTQAKSIGGLGMGAMWTSALFLTVIVLLVAVAQLGSNDKSTLVTRYAQQNRPLYKVFFQLAAIMLFAVLTESLAITLCIAE